MVGNKQIVLYMPSTIMNPSLDCEEIIATFKALATLNDVAILLGISNRALRSHLYSKTIAEASYRQFELHKKSGGVRAITAPIGFWKTVQSRLHKILQCIYEPKATVHGFTLNHSIVTNAEKHLGRRWVLNLDLSDFFPTINFGRVRGVFMAAPYNVPEKIATILAQICCHKNQLPQGAPTSPTVSNMVCARLDSHLGGLASAYRCTYTRYADDLTLSTDQRDFPKELAQLRQLDGKLRCVAGSRIRRVIRKNGFEINLSKARLQLYNQRQEVTGLITNKRVNVPRQFLREIRATLFNIRRKGLEAAQNDYELKYASFRNRSPDRPQPPLIYVLRGRIEYVGMVRGKEDRIYYKFLKELDSLVPDFVKVPLLSDELEGLFEHLFLITTDENQGTAFLLKGVGLVTASHVLGDGSDVITTRSHDGVERQARIVVRDSLLDLAILDIGLDAVSGLELSQLEPKARAPILLLGFPNHNLEDSAQVREGHISGTRRDPTSNERLILLNASVIYGNSGGPVLDGSNRVIGVALRGATNQLEAQRTEFHAAMPASAILRLARI